MTSTIEKDAILSEDGAYRYMLTRTWNSIRPADVWVMLNPSIADATIDDPTIRRCIGFSKGWGAGGITVVNLFALRATNPKELLKATDPIGPENDRYLRQAFDAARIAGGRVVAGWGAHGMAERRAQQVRALTSGMIECVGVTGSGAPKHPLYVKGDTQPIRWWGQ